ncbi:molybdopterin-dependent oxidoreductase [Aureimonas leprariae]|nr:molybdopterin-dependent oxidoreductase [Aureimonas leprariae]
MLDRFQACGHAIVLCVGLTLPATAEMPAGSVPKIEVAGEGVQNIALDRSDLSAMPSVEQEIAFQTSKGEHRGRYRGVPLLAVLERVGLLAADGHHAELRRSVLVKGRDGYSVAFSVGELEPDFGDRAAMIALTENGRPLFEREGLRLIMPGDKRGARSVMDVVRIEVR